MARGASLSCRWCRSHCHSLIVLSGECIGVSNPSLICFSLTTLIHHCLIYHNTIGSLGELEGYCFHETLLGNKLPPYFEWGNCFLTYKSCCGLIQRLILWHAAHDERRTLQEIYIAPYIFIIFHDTTVSCHFTFGGNTVVVLPHLPHETIDIHRLENVCFR